MRARPEPLVLLVEDNAGDAILIESALGEVGFGCTVVPVHNAIQGYAFLLGTAPYRHATLPDLILLDLDLPVVSGLDFLRKLRASPTGRGVAVIVFSGSSRPGDRAEALSLGALCFLPKPPVWSQYERAACAIQAAWRAHRDRIAARLVDLGRSAPEA